MAREKVLGMAKVIEISHQSLPQVIVIKMIEQDVHVLESCGP